MTDTPAIAVSHVGICVADLDRATRFYVDALGFEATAPLEVGDAFARLVEISDATLRVAFMTKAGFKLELLSYVRPDATGAGERRAMNARGFTHLNLVVADLDAVAARIREHGGHVIEETRTVSPQGTMIFCTDPDGARIELWQPPASAGA